VSTFCYVATFVFSLLHLSVYLSLFSGLSSPRCWYRDECENRLRLLIGELRHTPDYGRSSSLLRLLGWHSFCHPDPEVRHRASRLYRSHWAGYPDWVLASAPPYLPWLDTLPNPPLVVQAASVYFSAQPLPVPTLSLSVTHMGSLYPEYYFEHLRAYLGHANDLLLYRQREKDPYADYLRIEEDRITLPVPFQLGSFYGKESAFLPYRLASYFYLKDMIRDGTLSETDFRLYMVFCQLLEAMFWDSRDPIDWNRPASASLLSLSYRPGR